MARRRNGMMDFLNNFNAGYGMVSRMADDWEKDDERRQMKEIATAKPVYSEGLTAEQSQSIGDAARAGDTISYDEPTKAYQATPQLGDGEMGPPQTRTVATMGPMTDFMGTRTAGTMTPEQVDTARMMQMADIVSGRDPAKAMQMRQQAKQTAREDERFAMEKTRFDRESRREDLKDSDDATMRDVDAQAADWFKQRLAPDGGAPRQATPDDHIAASVHKASLLTQAGKIKEAGEVVKAADAQILAKIVLDTEQRKAATGKVAASLAAGDFEPAKEFFNRYLGGGARVTNVGPVRETGQIVIERETADGKPLPATILKSANDLIAGLQAFSNPMAVYEFAAQDLRQQLQLNADKRADKTLDNQTAATQATLDEQARKVEAERRKGLSGMALFKENNPNATPVQLEAVGAGVLSPVPKSGGYKTEAGDVTSLLGSPAARADGKPIMDVLTGRQAVNRDVAREQEFWRFMREKGIKDTNEGLQKFLQQENGGNTATAGAKQPAPSKGAVVAGHEFLGGDPKNPKSWRAVSSGSVQ